MNRALEIFFFDLTVFLSIAVVPLMEGGGSPTAESPEKPYGTQLGVCNGH